MKIIVYTTNLGDYDMLHETPNVKFGIDDGFTYLYYTDGDAPDGWQKVEFNGDSRKESRYYKINSHLLPQHDISIYLDACYSFKSGIDNFHSYVDNCDIAIAKHGRDEDIYSHLGTCIHTEKDDPKKMVKQVCRYLSEGLPDHTLTENSIIIRRNNDKVKQMNEIWWNEYLIGSERDQLSLPYAIWKSGVNLSVLPFSARDNQYLTGWATHRNQSFDFNPEDSEEWDIIKNNIQEKWNFSENKAQNNITDLLS